MKLIKFKLVCIQIIEWFIAPSCGDIFDINYDIHDDNTRHKSDIHVIARLCARTICIKVFGAKLCNSLHQSIHKSNSYRQFKNYYKIYI